MMDGSPKLPSSMMPTSSTACWYQSPDPGMYQSQPSDLYNQIMAPGVKEVAVHAQQRQAQTVPASTAAIPAAVNSAYPVQYVPMNWTDVYGNGHTGQPATSMGSQFQLGGAEGGQAWQPQPQQMQIQAQSTGASASSSSNVTPTDSSSNYDGFLPAKTKLPSGSRTTAAAARNQNQVTPPCGNCKACEYQNQSKTAGAATATSASFTSRPTATATRSSGASAKGSGIHLVRDRGGSSSPASSAAGAPNKSKNATVTPKSSKTSTAGTKKPGGPNSKK